MGASPQILQPTTNFLQFTAFRSTLFHSRPVHSSVLSSHRFPSLPLRHPPCTVPCRIILASPDDLVMCPYHSSLHLFTEFRSSYGQMTFFRSGFHFLIGYVISVRNTQEFAETSHLQCLYPSFNVCCYGPCFTCIQNMDKTRERKTRERISLILELIAMFLSFQMTFSLVTAAVVWAILESTSDLDPPSGTIAPRYLKLRMVSIF